MTSQHELEGDQNGTQDGRLIGKTVERLTKDCSCAFVITFPEQLGESIAG